MPKALLLISVTVALCSGCGDNQEPEKAAELLGRIRDQGYRDWDRAPGYPGREGSSAPHGDAVEIYVNDVVQDALDNEQGLDRWPDNAIIAKDGYEDGDFEYLAVMEKQDGQWFWVEEIDGDVKYSGSPDTCTDCHRSGDDFVLAFALP
jgi:hypothetical protein